ncbi:MAG TPA: hypothetical protein VKK19_13835 [Candidatus Dormibacteraeota bacterium]|nr:hypothetical protein [Candidatus Dormibacteraeota bacterium]
MFLLAASQIRRRNAAEGGDLVLEPVCVHQVTQPDAVSACAGYHNPLAIRPGPTSPPPGRGYSRAEDNIPE